MNKKINIIGIIIFLFSLSYLTIYTMIIDLYYGISMGLISILFIIIILKSKKKKNE
jgi:hypothetical protein